MLYHLLYPLHVDYSIFNVFKYITFRTIYASVTALIIALLFGPWFIRFTLIAPGEAALAAELAKLRRETGIDDILSLRATRTFKINARFEV